MRTPDSLRVANFVLGRTVSAEQSAPITNSRPNSFFNLVLQSKLWKDLHKRESSGRHGAIVHSSLDHIPNVISVYKEFIEEFRPIFQADNKAMFYQWLAKQEWTDKRVQLSPSQKQIATLMPYGPVQISLSYHIAPLMVKYDIPTSVLTDEKWIEDMSAWSLCTRPRFYNKNAPADLVDARRGVPLIPIAIDWIDPINPKFSISEKYADKPGVVRSENVLVPSYCGPLEEEWANRMNAFPTY